MKLIKLFVIALVLVSFATPALAGGLWDMYKNSDLPTKQATAFQLEVKGVNTRVYVFNVPEMQSVCTISYGDETASQMVCKTYQEQGLTAKQLKALPK